jgi:hypothetical protein
MLLRYMGKGMKRADLGRGEGGLQRGHNKGPAYLTTVLELGKPFRLVSI